MSLEIKIIQNKIIERDNLPTVLGCLFINGWWGTFVTSLDCWTVDNYIQQWDEGIERIKKHGRSCLITSIQELESDPLINCWLLYKVNSKIFIKNEIFADDNYHKYIGDKTITMANCYDFTSQINFSNKDLKVLEWSVAINKLTTTKN